MTYLGVGGVDGRTGFGRGAQSNNIRQRRFGVCLVVEGDVDKYDGIACYSEKTHTGKRRRTRFVLIRLKLTNDRVVDVFPTAIVNKPCAVSFGPPSVLSVLAVRFI